MERGVAIDVPGFDEAMEEQRARARADAAEKRAVVNVNDLPSVVSVFHGYSGLETDGEIVMIMRDGQPVDELVAGENAQIFLDHTSFYAEKGGQIGDHGDADRRRSDLRRHRHAVRRRRDRTSRHATLRGFCAAANACTRPSIREWREEIRRHHTSAHLLQKALKEILGDEVAQAGSWVGIDRMRFDFRWPGGALTTEQQDAVSQRVNAMIREDHHLVTRELPIEEAKTDRRLLDGGREIWRAGARRTGRTVGRVLRRHARAHDRRARHVHHALGVVDRQRRAAHRIVRLARGRRHSCRISSISSRRYPDGFRANRTRCSNASERCKPRFATCRKPSAI